MRVGIFGGTFDPVHQGHLILAEQARDQAGLDEVWFLPAPRPPQKGGQPITRYESRVEMLELALAGQPAFRINQIEKDRPGPSYTADTLQILQERHPDHGYSLLLGGDSLADMPFWYRPLEIVARAELVVMARPGVPVLGEAELRQQLGMQKGDVLRLRFVEAPQIDIASRDLRRWVGMGRSIRYLLPRAVEVYVHERKLYRE